MLQGFIKPHECAAFGKECTPRNPLGATMVSSEGACAAYYLYRRLDAGAGPGGDHRPRGGLRCLTRSHDVAEPALDFEGLDLPGSVAGQPNRRDGPRRRRPDVAPSWSSTCSCRPSATSRAPATATQRVFELGGARLAFSTDTFVVQPLFFPGGSIGHLAVNGTVNDLAMSGAVPSHLSCGFILEEGTDLSVVGRIAQDMGDAARAAGVAIVTG